jgi:large subunit ribosomal protein L21
MYAIVDIAGQQFKVEKGQEIFVHRLQGDAGTRVEFPRVMLIENEGKSLIGTPVIQGAQVMGTILEHLKADKLFVFKKKRRKGYQKFNGHRQYLSLIRIEEIVEEGAVVQVKEEAVKEIPVKKAAAPKKKTVKETVEATAAEVKPKAPRKKAVKKEE